MYPIFKQDTTLIPFTNFLGHQSTKRTSTHGSFSTFSFFQLPRDVYPELPETVIRACSRPRISKFHPHQSWPQGPCARHLQRLSTFFFQIFGWWSLGEGEKIQIFFGEKTPCKMEKVYLSGTFDRWFFRRKRCSTSIITREYHIVYAYRFCLELMVRNKQRQQQKPCYIWWEVAMFKHKTIQ